MKCVLNATIGVEESQLHYEGLVDANNSLIPTNGIYPGRTIISELRNVYHIKGDVHYTKHSLDCIDCHTSRDLMGDSYIYENMYKQVEIACEDCQWQPYKKPEYGIVLKENNGALIEAENYAVKNKYEKKLVKQRKEDFTLMCIMKMVVIIYILKEKVKSISYQ